MKPVTYKLVMDSKGTISGVELWQNGQHISVSLETAGLMNNGYRWVEVHAAVNNLRKLAYENTPVSQGSLVAQEIARR